MKGLRAGWGAAALATALMAGVGIDAARAQDVPPGCVVVGNPNGAAAGALVGGVAGALLGNALGGRRKAPGTIIGGVAGAATGAAIGGAGHVRCPEGYAYREGPPPRAVDVVEAPAGAEGTIWYGAPPRIRERIVFLRHRIDRMDADGFLSPRERDGAIRRLREVAARETNIRDRHDGVLPPEARERLNDDLNEIAGMLRWEKYRAAHADN